MREREIEQRFVTAVRRQGGMALKFIAPGMDGMPDRIVLFPEGKIGFVEVKAPGEKPRPLQLARHAKLRHMGFRVYVLDNKEQIKSIIAEIGGDPPGTRVKLERMNDPYSKLRYGDLGTVISVDDIATIHVSWDRGSSLGVVYGEDSVEKVKEEQ